MGVLAIVRVPSTRGWDEETGADVLPALAGRPPTGAVAWPKRRNPTTHSPAGRGRRARKISARGSERLLRGLSIDEEDDDADI